MAAKQDHFQSALTSNAHWASSTTTDHLTLSKGQSPPLLWIGCSDSRVPESTLLALPPGTIFTHRNIANLVTHTDASLGAVVEYAVGALGVQEVILAGHSGCGGCTAAVGNGKVGLGVGFVDAWLLPLRSVRRGVVERMGLEKWGGLSQADKVKVMVEENVKVGVRTLREMDVVVKAGRERGLRVHGVVYEIGEGRLRELDCGEGVEEGKIREEAFALG